MSIRTDPPIPPNSFPDSFDIYNENGFAGRARYGRLTDNQKGYCFYPATGFGAGKMGLREIADKLEQANKLRGTDY